MSTTRSGRSRTCLTAGQTGKLEQDKPANMETGTQLMEQGELANIKPADTDTAKQDIEPATIKQENEPATNKQVLEPASYMTIASMGGQLALGNVESPERQQQDRWGKYK